MDDVAELQHLLRSARRVMPRGSGTKTGLSRVPRNVEVADLGSLDGVVDHQPSEFTITVRAGESIAALQKRLADAGQYLPFDPVLGESGATVGGTVASGLSGSGRHRYGGIRDFILAVEIVDGTGRRIRGGERVVKNAAGFDLPKLMVSSLGLLGVLVEVTFKVFPRPAARATIRWLAGSLEAALAKVVEIRRRPYDLEALDFDSTGVVHVRVAGLETALGARVDRLRRELGGAEVLDSQTARAYWSRRLELDGAGHPDGAGHSDRAGHPDGGRPTLVKVPTTPSTIPALDRAVSAIATRRDYEAGAQQAWIALRHPDSVGTLHRILGDLSLSGLVVLAGDDVAARLGAQRGRTLEMRARQALDPESRLDRPLDSGRDG